MTARRTLAAAIAAAALIAADGAIAQTAEQMRERAAAYAEAVALAPTSTDQYARWDDDICPRVAGLPGAEAQALIDHVARRAHEVGLGTGSAGCTANLIVIFAPSAATVAREIVDTRRDLLGYYSERNTSNAGRDALDAFVNSQRAVRWWHVARTVGADGDDLGVGQAERGNAGPESAVRQAAGVGNSPAALSAGSFEGVDTVRSSGARTRRNTRQDLRFALVIVEAPRASGASRQAIGDYVAMAALTQLNPDADMSSFPSILNLFNSASQPAPTAMTQWDNAFLRGLYRTRRDAAARQQRNDIARRMADQIAANLAQPSTHHQHGESRFAYRPRHDSGIAVRGHRRVRPGPSRRSGVTPIRGRSARSRRPAGGRSAASQRAKRRPGARRGALPGGPRHGKPPALVAASALPCRSTPGGRRLATAERADNGRRSGTESHAAAGQPAAALKRRLIDRSNKS